MSFLQLTNIRKEFGSGATHTVAVQNFNLEVQRGEFVSFLGTSGCGKTTTLRMIAGFEMPTSGLIKIDDKDVTNVPPNKRNVGMVFQSYALFPHMSVNDNIGFGLKIAKQSSSEIKQRVGEMLALIGLESKGNNYPHQLSGGQQQRVALARAIAIKPTVLLLDEPLSALDAKIRVSLREEIRAIQKRLNITTIYVTHDQEEALSLSDRVVVMNAGNIEQVGTPFEIYNFPATPFVASFVGTLNQIKGVVRDAHTVAIEGQAVKVAQPINRKAGDAVAIAIRPEMIALGDLSGTNHLKATVADVTFLGSIVRVQFQLGETRLEMDVFNNPNLALPKVGSEVTVSFSPEAVKVL
jgi:putative spermidine/putrescine transport system ATP-binding protein